MNRARAWRTLGILAVTQIISWGSIYYAFAIVATDIQNELGWRSELVFGAFSCSLLVYGMFSTPPGILLDCYGGRFVMAFGSLLAAVGFLVLSKAQSLPAYYVAWALLGAAMALTLYEAAFATITRKFQENSRWAISILTLFGGFASTVFWPLTLSVAGSYGWRDTFVCYALLHLLVCLPLHLLLKPDAVRRPNAKQNTNSDDHTLTTALKHPVFWRLAFAFSANSFIFSALSVHRIPLMRQCGHTASIAVTFAALIGPAQVLARVIEMALSRRIRPSSAGWFSFAALPAALAAMLFAGREQWVLVLFCLVYGMSNGILTIVRGTIPQVLFGRTNYGAISGALSGPALFAKAAGPVVVAAVIQYASDPYQPLCLLLVLALVSVGFYSLALRGAGRSSTSVVT